MRFAVGTYSKIFYMDANDTIEKYTKLFAQLMFVTTIIFMLLPLLYTIVSYFILDSGEESFFLFFPTWFVFLPENNLLN